MQKLSSILLLIAAAAVASAAAKASPNFGDWLALQADGSTKAGASAAKTAYAEREYEEVETVETCLKASSYKHCGLGTSFYFESGLSCCNSKDYYNKDSSFMTTPTEVGECDFTVFLIGSPREVAENVEKTFTFIATCTLNGHADDCGAPFCDKMVISVQGGVYQVTDAIVSSLPGPPMELGNCDNFFNDLDKKAAQSPVMKEIAEMAKKSKVVPTKKSTAKAAYARDGPEYREEYHNYDRPQLYKVNYATVYYGAMTVTSRFHNAKVSGGWFEFVRGIEYDAPPTPVASAEHKYVLDPYTYKLTFTKTKGY